MPRSGDRKKTLVAACAGSLALHALVIAGAARVSFNAAEREQARVIDVVWLAELPIADRSRAETPMVAPAEPAAEIMPDRATAPAPATLPERETLPEPEALPDDRPPATETQPPAPPEPAPDAERETAESEAPEPEALPEPDRLPEPLRAAEDAADAPRRSAVDEPRTDETSGGFAVTEADLDEAWRRALDELREQSERERGYMTFSLDDVIDEPPPKEPGQPEESIFEAAERYRGRGPSVLSPGSARTRVGRALAELCNALTGGFGIGFGGKSFASVCADPGESAKLFAHIKPAYLRSRPVCTEVETGTVLADGEAPTIKCELVEQEELDAR